MEAKSKVLGPIGLWKLGPLFIVLDDRARIYERGK